MEVLFYLFLYLFKLILNDCSYLAGQYCVCMFNYFSGSMWPDNLSSICAVAELQKNPFNRHLNTQSFSLGRNKINDNCYLHRHTWMQKICLSYSEAVHSSRLLLWIFCRKPSWAHFQILLYTLNRSILPCCLLRHLRPAPVSEAQLSNSRSFMVCPQAPACGVAWRGAQWLWPQPWAARTAWSRRSSAGCCHQLWCSKGEAKATCSIAWHHICASAWF